MDLRTFRRNGPGLAECESEAAWRRLWGLSRNRRSFHVVSRRQNRRFRRSAGFLQRVRFPAATPEGPQIRLVSKSRTCRRRFQARASLRYIRSWRCHCGGDNPSRTCDAAKVSARAAKRPVPRRIPALSGRTSAHRATAPSAFRPRRLPGRIAPAINPQKKPRRKNPRARRLFLRTTADAMNPHVAAMMATARSREIRCVGPSDPISQPPGRRLRRPLARSNHRLRRTSIAGQCS
jgi:hypothetical protein